MKHLRQLLLPPAEMNRVFSMCLMFLILGFGPAFATAFDDANRQYQSGDFAGAAASYEKIIMNEGPRAAVFYNLGNSYLSIKRYGHAILAYERCRLLTPRDPDLLANLLIARKAAACFEVARMDPRLAAILGRLSRDEWSWLVAGSALFLGAVVLVGGWIRLPNRISNFVVTVASAAGFLIIVGSAVLYLRRGESEMGIVLSQNASVWLSPFEKAESLGTPGTGKMVRLGAKSGDFQYVEVTGTNLRGWLGKEDVAAIVPQ